MALAGREAQRFNHNYIGTEHILLGLIMEGGGLGSNILKAHGIDLQKVRTELERLVRPEAGGSTKDKLPNTPGAKKVIEYAIGEARRMGHAYVGTEHLLLGLLRTEEGLGSQILKQFGISLEATRDLCVFRLKEGGKEGAETVAIGEDRIDKVFAAAREEMAKTGCDKMHPEHMLLGLFREDSARTAEIVRAAAESLDAARQKVRQMLQPPAPPTTHPPSASTPSKAEIEAIKEQLADANPVKRYVNLVLLDLARVGGGEVTLRQGQPLPVPPEGSLEGVDFGHVINRLKVMANVDPVLSPQPVEGRIELVVNGVPFTAHVRFDDHAADRSCHIRLVKDGGSA